MFPHRVRRSSLGLLAAAVAAALLLSACSGGAEKKAEEDMGPLDKYMTALYSTSEMTQEKLDEQHKKTEELTAKCMAKEGFEYKPNPQNHTFINNPDEEHGEEIDWNSVEFAEKYGYGIVESPFFSQLNPEANSGHGGNGTKPEEEWVDVNADYVLSLSEKQRDAYIEALHGPQLHEGNEPPAEYDWKTAGCAGAAQHEVEGDDPFQSANNDPEFSELLAAVDAHSMSLHGDGRSGPTDPEIVKLDAKWAECMAESGITGYTNTMTANNALTEESNNLFGADSSDSTPKEPSKEQLEALKKKEISVAVPDAKCREKLHYEDESRKIDIAFQEKFVKENKAKLEALVAKHGSKHGSE